MTRHSDIAKEQPAWVCSDCGNEFRAGEWFICSTWHIGECSVCDKIAPVTEPRDCGYLREGWNK